MKVITPFLLFLPVFLFACGGTYTSDEEGSPTGPLFSTNDFIYLTGDLDRTNPPTEIFPVADIYIMRNYGFTGDNPFPLWDDEGAKNVVIGTYFPGSYIGELIAMPPIPEGEYDIVVDEDQDGIFNPGIDCLVEPGSSYGFKVVYYGDLPRWLTVEVERIKSLAAAESLALANASRTFTLGLFASSVAGVAFSFWTDGVFLGCVNLAGMILGIPLSYNDAVVQIGQPIVQSLLSAQQAHFASIALDPPDTSHLRIAPASTLNFYPAISDFQLNQLQRKFIQLLAIQLSLSDAMRRSIEKYQGALNEHEALSRRTQAKGIIKYSRLLKRSLLLSCSVLDSLRSYILANGLDITLSRTNIQSVKNRLSFSGFTPDEVALFDRYGISVSARDSMRNALLSIDTAYVVPGRYSDFLDSLKRSFNYAVFVLDTIIVDAQELVDSMSSPYGVDNGRGSPDVEPYGVIWGDSIFYLGSALALNVVDTNSSFHATTFEWDTDLDGYFDDATGTSITFSPNEEGFYLVGVRLSNSIGMVDYAYRIVEAKIGNRAPVIQTFSPESVFVRIPINSSFNFNVSAIEPEGEPISYRWFLDDILVGNSNSFTYNPSSADIGFHLLKVIVSDNNPYSNDAGFQWRISVYNPLTVDERTGMPSMVNIFAYPNPFNKLVRVVVDGVRDEMIEFSVYNIKGERIFEVSSRENVFEWVPEQNLSSGLYFIKIMVNSKVFVKAVIYMK